MLNPGIAEAPQAACAKAGSIVLLPSRPDRQLCGIPLRCALPPGIDRRSEPLAPWATELDPIPLWGWAPRD